MGKHDKKFKKDKTSTAVEEVSEPAPVEKAKRPKHAGPSILETYWDEMDRLMEGLMTKTDNEDGGDRYRAEMLAFCLAVMTNPYEPNLDAIREETVRRWEAAQAEESK